jgi:EmrB/QacA subfamily drug resistance transporter
MTDSDPSSRMSVKELLIVLVVSLGSFMAGLDATIVNIALPSISKAFSVSTTLASWVLNAYLIILISLLLAAARIGDIRGYRNVFLIGFAIFTVGSALCGISPDIGLLIGFRVVQAAGGAVIAALGAVMVTSYLGPQVRGQALGLVAMFTMLGAAMGPVIGGFLTSALSWQYIFFVNIPVGILAILLGISVIPTLPAVSPKGHLDIPGVILLFVVLSSLILGLNMVQGGETLTGGALLVVTLVFFALFLMRQKRTEEPLVDLSIFSNTSYTFQSISILILQMGLAGVMFLMPFYLEIVRGFPTGTSGAFLLSLPVGNILTAPIAGRISDVIGTKKPIILGFIISIIALFLLSTLSAHSPPHLVVLYLFILGAGAGIAYAPLNSAIMGESPDKERGMTSGLIKMMTNLGSSLGITLTLTVATVVAGPALAHTAAHSLRSSDLVPAFDVAFLFCMSVQVLALLLMLLAKDRTGGSPLPHESAY